MQQRFSIGVIHFDYTIAAPQDLRFWFYVKYFFAVRFILVLVHFVLICLCMQFDNLSSCYTGDVFYANWDEVLLGATAVVSTLGGFGSEEQMKRINGEANVVAVNAAKDFGKHCQ